MLIAIYDTETQCLPDFKVPSESEHQPHIVDIAVGIFDDDTGDMVDSFEALVRPDGWVIPDETIAIHGITNEIAAAEGIDESMAVRGALHLLNSVKCRIAHNEAFDQRILRIAIMRFGYGKEDWESLSAEDKRDLADAFKARDAKCTMNLSKPILAIPATPAMVKSGRGSWKKPPSLQEAHQHFLGEGFEGAHRAMVDVQACARVYFAMKRDGHL